MANMRQIGGFPKASKYNNHILTQNMYDNSYYTKPKYLIIGYLDPLGCYYSQLGMGDTYRRYLGPYRGLKFRV